jgi:alkanesulfonate monooxygenase SsuD/methylene tetrahydromethanopterin reductase-like flavin-dependent oxidoreductase (luciferase family)
MLRLTGRVADGWVPSLGQSTPETLGRAAGTIDEAARQAGRDPASIQRLLNVGGAVDAPGDGLSGPADDWVARLTALAVEQGFDTFVYWPPDNAPEQVERFAASIARAVRDLVAQARAARL